MNRVLLPLAALSILSAASCGATNPPASTPGSAELASHAAPAAVAQAPAASKAPPAPAMRQPGDFVVFKFSGSFRKAPLTVTERVVARTGNVLVVDVTADDGKGKRILRVRFNDAPGARGEVVGVAKLERGAEKAVPIDTFDAMMAEAAMVADENLAVLGTEEMQVTAGKENIACTRTSYQVRVGGKQATLRTISSPAFAWGDVGGEITNDAGRTLYRAELVDMGHAEAPSGAVAHSDLDD